LINALDDPFLSESCFPTEAATENPHFSLMTPQYGGHVGFVSKGKMRVAINGWAKLSFNAV